MQGGLVVAGDMLQNSPAVGSLSTTLCALPSRDVNTMAVKGRQAGRGRMGVSSRHTTQRACPDHARGGGFPLSPIYQLG
jgi:hypothetical protein